jgi:hypothetical protein
MRERFAQLLHGFSLLAAQSCTSVAPHTDRFRNLLEQFGERRYRADTLDHKQAAGDRVQISTLIDGYNEAVDRYRQQQEQFADDFNLLDVMRLTSKEIQHSMVLAWLLDHDIRKHGTHAQGNLGFRLFLTEFGFPLDYADCKYLVRREVPGDKSIVDIEVACRGLFLIHIENKIWSWEGPDQTNREWSDLQRRADRLNVPAPGRHALFLSVRSEEPDNTNFRAISWGRMVRVITRFAEQAKPADVKLFAAHYAKALRRFIVVQDMSEDDNG